MGYPDKHNENPVWIFIGRPYGRILLLQNPGLFTLEMPSRLSYSIALAVFLFDQLAKKYISKSLSLGRSIPVIKDIFHLTLVHNSGVAFGLFKNRQAFFIIITSIVILYITLALFLNRKQNSLSSRIAFGLILGGACGNLLDRLRLGFIVDFFDFRIWPVFNIADSAITIGIFILAIDFLVRPKQEAGDNKYRVT